jgi:hypothetical protein
MKSGFVYILSNPAYKEMLKVGRTSDLPEARAKSLSSHAGVLESFKVEWSKEVPNIVLAEYMLHHVLSPYSYKKEYFTIPLADAVKICNEALNRLFKPLKSLKNAPLPNIKALEKEADELYNLLNESGEGYKSKIDPAKLERFKVKAKALKLELELHSLDSEKKSGISIIPLGEKDTTWEMVSESITYSFGKEAIHLCLKEGKVGDPLRKRFVSYRSKYMNMDRIDLYFTKKHLFVGIKTADILKEKNKKELKKLFVSDYKKLDITDWKYGFNFKITTPQQFKTLKKILKMGSKLGGTT